MRAERAHIQALPEIERAAAALFPEELIPPEMRTQTVPVEELEAARVEGRLWTAVTRSGEPVGFAIAMREADAGFLREINVHPAHQQKGIGRQLIAQVIAWARANQLPCVALTTFESVPWNAPFYSRLGFRRLTSRELSRELIERLEAERQQGLRQRVAMQCDIHRG